MKPLKVACIIFHHEEHEGEKESFVLSDEFKIR